MSNACTPIFVGVTSSVLEILLLSKVAKFPFGPVTKKLNQIESAQKLMQVGVDIKCMHTNFGGYSLFGFGDITTFQIWPNFPFGPWYSSW